MIGQDNDYIGKYGPALRRLSALEAEAMGQPAPAAPAGAFGDAAPQQQGAFALAQQGPQGGMPEALGGLSAPPKGQFKDDMTPSDLWDEMPDEDKDKVIQQAEKATGKSVDDIYAEAAKKGGAELPPPKDPDKYEKMGYAAEVLFRFASNMGAHGRGGKAAADAVLQTQERRGALEMYEKEKGEKAAETRRLEAREDTEKRRVEGRDDYWKGRTERNQSIKDAESREAQIHDQVAREQHAEKLARMQIQAQREQEKGKNVVVQVETDGTIRLIDKDTGSVVTPTVEEEVPVAFSRGKKGTEKRQRPLKSRSGTMDQTLDPEILRGIQKEKDAIRDNSQALRAIRTQAEAAGIDPEQALEQVARERVMGRAGGFSAGGGEKDPLGIR